MSARISQEGIQVLAEGNPNARISQEGIQVLAEGNPNARISQEALTALAEGFPTARISQMSCIFLYIPGIYAGDSDTESFYFPLPAQVGI